MKFYLGLFNPIFPLKSCQFDIFHWFIFRKKDLKICLSMQNFVASQSLLNKTQRYLKREQIIRDFLLFLIALSNFRNIHQSQNKIFLQVYYGFLQVRFGSIWLTQRKARQTAKRTLKLQHKITQFDWTDWSLALFLVELDIDQVFKSDKKPLLSKRSNLVITTEILKFK